MIFSLPALWWKRIRSLWKFPDGRDWLRGKLGLVLMGRAMLSKSLILFSVDGWSCVPSLLFTWGQTMMDRGGDDWMASLNQWTWVWVNSGSWWWTGRPGVLQFMGSQRVRHDWVTELNWIYGGGNEDNGDLIVFSLSLRNSWPLLSHVFGLSSWLMFLFHLMPSAINSFSFISLLSMTLVSQNFPGHLSRR